MNQVQTGLEKLLAEITDFDAFGSQVERVDQELAVSSSHDIFVFVILSHLHSKNYDVILAILLNLHSITPFVGLKLMLDVGTGRKFRYRQKCKSNINRCCSNARDIVPFSNSNHWQQNSPTNSIEFFGISLPVCQVLVAIRWTAASRRDGVCLAFDS